MQIRSVCFTCIKNSLDFIFLYDFFPKSNVMNPVLSQWCTEMITDTIKTIVRKLRFKWMFIHWSNARQTHYFQFILVNIDMWMWNGWIKTPSMNNRMISVLESPHSSVSPSRSMCWTYGGSLWCTIASSFFGHDSPWRANNWNEGRCLITDRCISTKLLLF